MKRPPLLGWPVFEVFLLLLVLIGFTFAVIIPVVHALR